MDNEPFTDEAERAEYESAMAEYYCKPVTVKCSACQLEQTAPTADLVKVGWTLENGRALCFQAWCKRERCVYCGHGRNWHLVDGLWCGQNGCNTCGAVGFESEALAMRRAA